MTAARQWCIARAAIVLLAALPWSAAAQGCPPDTLAMSDDCTSAGALAVVVSSDTARVIESFNACQTNRVQQASYDLAQGMLFASASRGAGVSPGFPAYATCAVRETFRVLGPVPGAPCAFTATLEVLSSTAGALVYDCPGNPPTYQCVLAAGYASAELMPSGGSAVRWDAPGEGTYSPTLSLPMSVAAGDSFDLLARVTADASRSDDIFAFISNSRRASARGRIGFHDLPDGVSIAGCHGFAAGQIVPTRNTSWGRLKVRYR